MKIQINPGDHVHGSEALGTSVSTMLEAALARYSGQITRVEVHMSDENAGKGGDHDKRCMLEARLEGRQPVAVTEHAATMKQALIGATDKLVHVLDKSLGRLRDHRKDAESAPQPSADET
jgi:ribosome-associated translation inhibitor RaiA